MTGTQKKSLAETAENVAFRLNWINERVCALLVAATVTTVWFGVVERYLFTMGAIWAEELARYFMIWAALMAVPCCAYRREHISLDLVFSRFPKSWHRPGRLILDLLGLAFFLFLFIHSIGMVRQGATEYASIFGMTMVVPFLSVLVSSLLTVVQIAVTMLREYTGTRPAFSQGVVNTN
jgi:TRAP-type C4-dicarboxylate transport system permease small subunit